MALWLAPAACASADWARPDYASLFAEVVFGEEADAAGHDKVYRWSAPIRVGWEGRVGERERALVGDNVAALRALTGHDVALAGADDRPNVRIFFADEEAFLAHLAAAGAEVSEFLAVSLDEGFCWSTYWARDARIVQAAVFVAERSDEGEDGGSSWRCLLHEMGHVVGLTYHPDDAYSVLDQHSTDDGYTTIDAMLLRLLYHPALHPGMPRDEAMRAVMELLRELA